MTGKTLGLAYLEEFKLDEAEKEFLKVIKLAPKEKQGYANLGLTYLRMGKYNDAEKQLFKAIELDSKDADIRLLLATVYQMDDKREKAILELKKALAFAPKHVKILYDISELLSVTKDRESQNQREKYLSELVKNAPANIVPQLKLIETFIKNGKIDKAIAHLEIIHKIFPKFPKEAIDYYNKTITLLKKGDQEKAIVQFTIFHNYLKVTSPYQAGLMDLKGPGGSLVGFPLITYDLKSSSSQSEDNKSILEVLRFTEVASLAGLNSPPENSDKDIKNQTYMAHVEAADYDGDGDTDLYLGNYDATTSTYKHYLYNNDMARFNDVSKEVGITHTGKERFSIFVDYDNDGFLDLYVLTDQGDILYRNAGKGVFENVTDKAKIGSKLGGNKAVFIDLDHDGDLDLFETTSNSNLVFRNNGDGTFLEQKGKMGLSKEGDYSIDVAFGDFDDDDDIDLITINKSGTCSLYFNQRQSVFKEVTEKSGLQNLQDLNSVEVGDFNNDGFLDLFITSKSGNKSLLYQNLGEGKFEMVKNTNKMFSNLKNVEIFDTKFFDFDNDGFIDILVAGKSTENKKRGLFIFHNEGNETFKDASQVLPTTPKSGRQLALFDYNDDGDLDILVAGINGGTYLLRNDGGSINHYMNLKLVGLRAGSAKNNYFGIGAKVEIRAGDLYQTMVVTKPDVYFGLGNHTKVDIVRITWTNGVPQNIFLPDADQALIEAQILKGSCPFLYTWNGEKYVFVKDIIWRSALGMPLGIMGGNMKHAFPNASDDYIKIPNKMLVPKDGKYSIKVTSELWETIYMDKIQLLAVDHLDAVDVYVPEQFSPPPFPGLKLYQVDKKITPVSAKDSEGNNLLPFVLKKDNSYVTNFLSGKYQGITQSHDLILNPGSTAKSKDLYLYLNGWIFPTDASINVALSQTDNLKVTPPKLQVKDKNGSWKTVIENIGFPMGKNKTVIVNLTDKFLSKDHRVRIVTNMEIYWDYIFFANSNPNTPLNTTVLNTESSDIHYRGFSKSYRKGGRYGPHWFDYYKVDKNRKWLDLKGKYTRYGDVNPLLLESDNQYIISNAGDETSIIFDANKLPVLKKGWKRDLFIHSVGWVKDGDLNTALGDAVLPLPFHGMSSYPPSDKDVYPKDPLLQKYLKKYNTRVVDNHEFKNAVKQE